MYTPLLQHIQRYVELTEAETDVLLSFFEHKKIGKKTFLLEQGQICRSNYFVLKGCLRSYFINEKGGEQMLQFAIENWWLTDYVSFDFQSPSHFFIQAIEPTEVAYFDKKDQEELLHQLPQLERYFRIILQRSYAASQLRIKYIFSLSGEERYHHFNNAFPEFVQRVPQYMLASYLGFTPEFLSKIRGKKEW